MKHLLPRCAVVLFAAIFSTAALASSEPPVETTGSQTELPAPPSVSQESLAHLPGVTLAEGVSQITGTAVSPLLGVSAVGAWKYVTTDAGERHRLPWYCHPWVWGSCFGVLGLCFLKDFLGAAAPPLVKKPLDFIELFEDKLSALVASTAFVPLVALAMAQVDAIPQAPEHAAVATTAQLGFATVPVIGVVDLAWLKVALYVPLAFIAFAVVWLSSHAINVLIAISPFGMVDAALKVVKLGVLGLITASAFVHPALGLLVCLMVIIPAFFVAGPAFRLMVFGNVFGFDLLLGRKAMAADLERGVLAFNASRVGSAPVRSYGRVTRDAEGKVTFRYRPWLVLPSREVVVDAQTHPDGLEKGLLCPSLTRDDITGRARTAFILLPRYRDCVERITECFGIAKVADSRLLRGLKAVRNWLVELLSLGRSPAALASKS